MSTDVKEPLLEGATAVADASQVNLQALEQAAKAYQARVGGDGVPTIGVLAEEPEENRVSITKDAARQLKEIGYNVKVEKGAGLRSSSHDEHYQAVGCDVVERDEVISSSQILCRIKAPQDEFNQMEGKTVISFVASRFPENRPIVEDAKKNNVTLLDMTMVPRTTVGQKLDVLSSQAKVQGHRAIVEATQAFGRFHQGEMTAAGKYSPSTTLILGCGVAGLAAIGTAKAMGSRVRAWDVRPAAGEQVVSMGAEWVEVDFEENASAAGGYAKESSQEFQNAQQETFRQELKGADIVVTSAAIPGKPAPILITSDMLEGMKAGSVIVDLSCHAGGNCKASEKGKITQTKNGITVIGYTDLPSRMAEQASAMYGQNMVNLIKHVQNYQDAAYRAREKQEKQVDADEDAKALQSYGGKWPDKKKDKDNWEKEDQRKKARKAKKAEENKRKATAIKGMFVPQLEKELAKPNEAEGDGEAAEIIIKSIPVCFNGADNKGPPPPPLDNRTIQKPEVKKEKAKPFGSAIKGTIILCAIMGILLGIGAAGKIAVLRSFLLAGAAGYQAVWGVAHALHTPLMAVTNAISGLTVLGGIEIFKSMFDKAEEGDSDDWLAMCLGAMSAAVSTINIVGGFVVTQRMLGLFQRKSDRITLQVSGAGSKDGVNMDGKYTQVVTDDGAPPSFQNASSKAKIVPNMKGIPQDLRGYKIQCELQDGRTVFAFFTEETAFKDKAEQKWKDAPKAPKEGEKDTRAECTVVPAVGKIVVDEDKDWTGFYLVLVPLFIIWSLQDPTKNIPVVEALCAVLCIAALACLATQASANLGCKFGIIGVVTGVATTLIGVATGPVEESLGNSTAATVGWDSPVMLGLSGCIAIGACLGLLIGSSVGPMKLPQTVAAFHSLVGLAAMTTSVAAFYKSPEAGVTVVNVSALLGNFIGGVTLTGSLIAFGKLNENLGSKELNLPCKNLINLTGLFLFIGVSAYVCLNGGDCWTPNSQCSPGEVGKSLHWGVAALSSLMGMHLVASVGGGDMPVCVTVLNSYSGWALAAEGFNMEKPLLACVGAIIGFSGAILTKIMCDAMNRDIANVLFGGMNVAAPAKEDTTERKEHQEGSDQELAVFLKEAQKIGIVPGYGMAQARAQNPVAALAKELKSRGKTVEFIIHPVAGRMPGQMNVLLAEASVPYDQVKEMDEVNDRMEDYDVCFCIGSNDIVNSAAVEREGCSIWGMPVIQVWKAKKCIFMKRSMATGYAALDNPVFFKENTWMYLGSADTTTEKLLTAFKAL